MAHKHVAFRDRKMRPRNICGSINTEMVQQGLEYSHDPPASETRQWIWMRSIAI